MFVEPLLRKTTESVIEAFKKIFDRTTLRPERIQSDQGKEFNSKKFQNFMKSNDIVYNTTNNPDTKASICERSIRTLKGRIFKYLTYNNTYTFINRLQDFVKAYNDSTHRTIKIAPSAVNDRNVLQVYENIRKSQHTPMRSNANRNINKKKKQKKRVSKVKVGDYVRISKSKNVFSKGYLKNYTVEVFKVKAVVPRDPVVYRIMDLKGEEIKGTFYEPEIQKIYFDETAARAIESIIKQKGKGKNLQYLVRWVGYNKSFDSWIYANTVTSI